MKNENESVRIDKYLWAVRIYKTRSLAAEACQSGKVMLNDFEAKPAKNVSPGDTLKIRNSPIWLVFRVKQVLANRVSASLVPEYLENATPAEEIKKLEDSKITKAGQRDRGAGRPTKKERRDLEKYSKGDLF